MMVTKLTKAEKTADKLDKFRAYWAAPVATEAQNAGEVPQVLCLAE